MIEISEPQHRLPPRGASTGQSIRFETVKVSSVQQMKDCCDFYVSKCSGKYQNSKVAGRYVYQLAHEILSLLSGIEKEIKRSQGEPEAYERLLAEWNEYFPPSLGAIGSPKYIASKLTLLEKEVTRLQVELKNEKFHRSNDANELLQSFNTQLLAYRQSMLEERQLSTENLNKESIENEENQSKLKSYYLNEIHSMKSNHQDMIQQLHNQYEQMKTTLTQQLEQLNVKSRKDIQTVENKNNKMVQIFIKKNRNLENNLKIAQDQIHELKLKLEDEISDDSLADIKLTETKDENEGEVKLKKKYKFSKAAIDALESMNKQLEEAIQRNQSFESTVTELQQNEIIMKQNMILYERRIKELEMINESLRKALLSTDLSDALSGGISRSFQPHPLYHTPHFLQRADYFGPSKNSHDRYIRGYKTAGIF